MQAKTTEPTVLLTVLSNGELIVAPSVTVGDLLQITDGIRQRVLSMPMAPRPEPKPQEAQP